MDLFDKIAKEINRELDYERRRKKRLRNWSYALLFAAILTIPLRLIFPEYASVFIVAYFVLWVPSLVFLWKS